MSPEYALDPFSNDPTRSTLPTSADVGRSNFRTSVITLDRPGDARVFDEKSRVEAAQIIARYPAGQARSALLPMLHLVQSVQGQVTADGIAFCSERLGLTKAQVTAVATFYTMYKRIPTGEYLISVCTNTLCGMLGGDEIFAELASELGVGNNESTGDGTFTLEHAECLAACDYAPVVTVNYEFFDNQTVGTARGLIGQLRDGERPLPTRGAPLCSFRQIERQIAGFYDSEDAIAAAANGSGVPTERGVQLAIERGDSAPSYSTSGSDGAAAEHAASRSRPEQGSAHDAPLKTAESDTANTAEPANERRNNTEED
ncbi:MAG: NADH-quinone oxidoreductase subunit NuoE [Actinomycetota bacterium]|nr:NADH-quinone oxidoreductase subunit NuoE [Actinomycetota bacterium]